MASITARSERQAMDWSLVLASQGIEVTPQQDPSTGHWQLQLPAADHARALHHIQHWRLENRRWAWRRAIPDSELHFHWGALAWVFGLALLHAAGPDVFQRGAFVTGLVRSGEWWRSLTATSLHADLGHLLSNLTVGSLVLGLAMGRYGAGLALLLSLAAGAAGNWTGYELRPIDYTGVGASGIVMGAIGLLAAQATALWRLSRHATRVILGGLIAGSALFLILGIDPRADLLAHAGGFGAGIVLGGLAALLPAGIQPRLNLAAGVAYGLLQLTAWSLALGR